MNMLAKVQRGVGIAGYKIAKNSPAILAVAGVVGFGVTAVLAYKARPKVEAIVEKVEKCNAEGTKVDNYEVGMDIIKALALPVAVGVASTASIILSYRIMHNRIVTLGSVLASVKAAQQAFENKVKDKYGEQAYNELVAYDRSTVKLTDVEGNETDSVEETLANIDATIGFWYKESEDYVSDNHDYNLAWIEEVKRKLEQRHFTKGVLRVSDIRNAFKVRKGSKFDIKNTHLLGFGPYKYFNIETIIINEEVKEGPNKGQIRPQILIQWPAPDYIYMEEDAAASNEFDM